MAFDLLNELNHLAASQFKAQQQPHRRKMDRFTQGAKVPDFLIHSLAMKVRDMCAKGVCDSNSPDAVKELAGMFLAKYPASEKLSQQDREDVLSVIAATVANMTENFNPAAMGTLSEEEKENVILYAASIINDHGVDAQEALGLALEDIPGMENADVTQIFDEEDIRRVYYVAQQAGQGGIRESLDKQSEYKEGTRVQALFNADEWVDATILFTDTEQSYNQGTWIYMIKTVEGQKTLMPHHNIRPANSMRESSGGVNHGPIFQKGEEALLSINAHDFIHVRVEDMEWQDHTWVYYVSDKDGKEFSVDEQKLNPL